MSLQPYEREFEERLGALDRVASRAQQRARAPQTAQARGLKEHLEELKVL